MNKLFTLLILIKVLFLSFTLRSSNAAPTDNKTEIFIIGTVHKGTFNFDGDTLLNILNKVNPDVILVECDTSYMTSDFKLKNEVKYIFPETQAITEYLKNKHAELRPYDINGRDTFLNNYNRKRYERNFFKDINTLSKEGKLNTEAIDILNKILGMMNIADEMANQRASYINNHEGSQKIDTINFYTYSGLSLLIDSVPELNEYKSYWEQEHDYWQLRNDTMLKNILGYEKLFKGKKIVVLCGFSHKNILKNGLTGESNGNIIVREFWEH